MKIKSFIMVIFGTFMCALSFNLFMVPYNILPGGISGIAIIVKKFYSIDRSLFILIVSIGLLLISLIFLGKKATKKSIFGSLLFPLFVYLTEILVTSLSIRIDNVLLSSVFGGLSFGFGLGIVFKEGYTTGGTNIVNQIISKYAHISMGMGMIITEGIIIVFGTLVFGFDIFMYSIITLYLSSLVINKVIIGISNSKCFYVITKEPEKVTSYIMNDLKHGVTILDGKGAYNNDHKKVLLSVIPTCDYYKLKEGLRIIDKEAFFVVCDSYEVGGGL